MVYIVLAIAIGLNALANILMKVGMNKINSAGFVGAGGMLTQMLVSPLIYLGILCFVLGLAGYCYALSHLNLSIAYPIMTSVGYCIVILVSWQFLEEAIVANQWLGFIMIMVGVWLVAR